MRNLKVALAAACAVVFGWVFAASAAYVPVEWTELGTPVTYTCATFYWRGTTDALASKPANWADADGNVATATPLTGDAIVLDAGSANKPMTWDLDDVVPGGWTQTADYTGTVTFQTGISRDKQTAHGVLDADGQTRILKVSGDITLNAGKWTHARNPDTVTATDGLGVYRLIVDAGGDFSLGESATIDVSALGFNTRRGPAASNGNCGGGHGGHGGFGNSGSLVVSDSIREPVMIGGAGYYNNSYSGSAFILKVARQTTIDGTIAANGQNSTTYYAPAGGSVFITTGTFAGGADAVISADGGGAPSGQGGGGGRISVLLTGDQSDFTDFRGTIRAAARKEKSASNNPGTGGTIYLETAADGANRGILIIDGVRTDDPSYANVPAHDAKNATLITGDNLNCRPKKLVLRNHAVVGVASGGTWDISETEIESDVAAGYSNTIRLMGGTVVLPETNYTDVCVASRVVGSVIRMKQDGTGVLKLGAGSTATFDKPLSIVGSLEVLSGGLVTHTANSTAQSYSIDLTVSGDVTVRAGGKVTARGKGYASNNGPGKANQGSSNRGASHGGIANKETGDICYGSPTQPTAIGSGGMSTSGGGAVKLTVAGTLVNDGSIDADGPSGSYHVGSGGSVWLTAARMSGSGTVTATGGHVTSYNTGGGGGRVALWLTDPTADFSSLDQTKVNAFGGDDRGRIYSAAGTVYFKTGAQAADEGTLVIANSNATTTVWTEIGSDMETVRVGSVVIRDKGRLRVRSGHRLEVGGDWANAGDFHADAGSVVELFSTNDAHIVGRSTFDTLVCAVGGKKLSFGTADTKTTIASGGKLVLNGAEGNLLELEGDAAGSWLLAAGEGADVSDLKFLKVTCCDATEVGQNLVADKSIDGGGNSENWTFSNVEPGASIAWTGAADGNWANGLNWNPERPPVETDVITVPSGCARYPTLTSPLTLNSLTVAEGATLTLAGNAVTVTNALTVAGTCVAGAADHFTVGGGVDLRGGTYIGRLTLVGANAQSVSAGESTLSEVIVEKSGGSVAWDNGLTADKLLAQVTAPLVMTVAAGKAVTLKELRLDGVIGAAVGLTLAASGEGQWSMRVSESERVSGVAVSNCVATGGLAIHGDAPYADLGGNVNWVFGEAAAVWQGGASGSFLTPENWSTGQVPGENDRVIIESGAVTLGAATEIAQLTVGGGESAASLTVTAALTVGGGVDVRDGGTLSLNAASTVGGSLFVRDGGTLTHKANSNSEAYKLDLTVADNATIEEGGAVDVTGKGYAAGNGPGYPGGNTASSYGGRGANGNAPEKVKPCYGSILRPFRLGSGSVGDAHYVSSSGGGAVKLTVGGTLTVDGSIVADGQHSGQMYYSATGGSIWLTVARLVGSGVIRANGTPVTSFCPGAGGRVALYQTEATDLSASQVTVQARGGYKDTGSTTDYRPHAASGTIYVKNAGDEFGTVILEDGNGVEKDTSDTLPFATDIPVLVDGDPVESYTEMNFEVSAGGVLSLTADCTINDLVLGKNGKVRLNDHTLTIMSPAHRRGRGWNAQRSIDLGANGQGKIVWPCGLRVFVK